MCAREKGREGVGVVCAPSVAFDRVAVRASEPLLVECASDRPSERMDRHTTLTALSPSSPPPPCSFFPPVQWSFCRVFLRPRAVVAMSQIEQIGRAFVSHYYTTFDSDRSQLGPLYVSSTRTRTHTHALAGR